MNYFEELLRSLEQALEIARELKAGIPESEIEEKFNCLIHTVEKN